MGQCTTTINSFPYDEGFEASQGNWSASSTAHWQWGQPIGKTVIPGAASGTNCWIAGGLTGSAYNSGSSELLSPCFNFSTLSYPEISFDAFWESELRFDGVVLLYTIDNGTNWLPLGTANSDDPCLGIENWFNYNAVNFINNRPGWSGNVQSGGGSCLSGQGSGQWVRAKHPLNSLAGQPSVIFKFVFGAGTICNGYDGFAVDNVHIGEAASNTGDFTYTCGSANHADFTNTSLPCQVGWNWDFGDTASGAANTSTDQNPGHDFSGPGTYTVRLTITYASGPPAVVPPKIIKILDVSTTVSPISCNGANDGSITVNVSPAGIHGYSWNTIPPQSTPTITGLSPNIPYTVTVTATGACSIQVPTTLSEPAPLSADPVIVPARCGNSNGSISANVSGGTSPYIYSWTTGGNTETINNLAPGSYGITIRDSRNCNVAPITGLVVPAVTNTVAPSIGGDTTICPGQSLLLKPGSFASYLWQDNSTGSTFTVRQSGNYSVRVTDVDGCTGTDSIKVVVDCRGIYFPSAFTPNSDATNQDFGPLGDLASLSKFNLAVYNRYAQVLFTTGNSSVRWDGTFKGKQVDQGSYVWIAVYTVRGQKPTTKKGTVIVLR